MATSQAAELSFNQSGFILIYAFLPCTSVAVMQFPDLVLFRHAVVPLWFPAKVSLSKPFELRQVSLMEVGSIESIPKLLLFSYLLYILYERTHLEIDIEGADKDDDGGDGLHEIGDRRLIGAYFLCCLGETGGALAGRQGIACSYCNGYGGECGLAN